MIGLHLPHAAGRHVLVAKDLAILKGQNEILLVLVPLRFDQAVEAWHLAFAFRMGPAH